MVLAAGKGTRLYPLTKNIPKSMMTLGNRPLLEHILLNLKDQGIKEIIINLHHLPEAITEHFGDGRDFEMNIKYSYEPRIMGTAGAVKRMAEEFSEQFLVIYGDNFWRFKLSGLIEFHWEKKGIATIALIKGTDPTSGGIAEIDQDFRITKFLEKPEKSQVFSSWINAGIYLMEPTVVDFIPNDSYYDFGNDLFPKILADHKIFGYPAGENLRGINTFEEYLEARRFFNQIT